MQRRDMDDAQRQAFIAQFEAGVTAGIVGFIVLGGVFAESVDLPGERLVGMVVVGVGLPPPSLERRALESSLAPLGRIAAYEQPAMTRVVQAAGRIIRSASDRGVLCLVDDRFLQPDYARYLPSHWQVTALRADQVEAALYAFWNNR
ncbi:MAG: hypothetical protein HC809_09460 [Gammaproteobacteria bacterium]|nr:hypothetical protein [Gammaproteobacteria bacterium]